ncbi:polysaccharide pyruvyl transferase family protein [Halomonas sp. QX-2]|uniref:Polysaccharide pyruvyl transferase family protein n=1 Tax=Vreelandella sedimenti TaxID=2729618 RepID=A0A7Z0SPV1_9GAMM|nr:polysaccharide pyruvyl transferase family protein [Halomonas sedimenti]NYT74346.1 polysaccharide pyruvyl transferase family protein [Halomonas sedimenti]
MRYLMIGAGHFLDGNDKQSNVFAFNDLLKQSGGNSGNYMIGEGVRFHILDFMDNDTDTFEYMPWSKFRLTTSAQLDENYDQVILAGANMINEKADFSFAYNKLAATSLPIFAMGVGAQAENYSDGIKVPTGTINFFKLIDERSASIGVRGDFTAYILESMGCSKVEINGCPSYYINKNNKDFYIEKNCEILNSAFLMKRDRNKYKSDMLLKEYQSAALRECIDKNFKLVVQTDYAEASTAYNKVMVSEPWGRLKKYFSIKKEEEQKFNNFFINNTGIYFCWDEWVDFLKGVNFSYGARFHGNMVALMNGIPALNITHDTRTKEFCETLNLPYIDIESLDKKYMTSDELYDYANFDNFNSQYGIMCKKFDDFLRLNLN